MRIFCKRILWEHQGIIGGGGCLYSLLKIRQRKALQRVRVCAPISTYAPVQKSSPRLVMWKVYLKNFLTMHWEWGHEAFQTLPPFWSVVISSPQSARTTPNLQSGSLPLPPILLGGWGRRGRGAWLQVRLQCDCCLQTNQVISDTLVFPLCNINHSDAQKWLFRCPTCMESQYLGERSQVFPWNLWVRDWLRPWLKL